MKKTMINLFKKFFSFFSKDLIVNVYNFLNKFYLLELLTNKMIKALIPESIDISEGKIFLNKSDVGVSGHLALGVYEKMEVNLFRDSIKEGMNIVDIGANIGYYSVIAGKKLNNTGRLFVFEPEKVNFSFLKKNIEFNGLRNVFFERVALSNKVGIEKFFLTEHNKGTHSLVNNRGVTKSILVKVDTLDSSLKKYGSPLIDLIKIDIEGAEILAIEGMKDTIEKNPNMIIFTEFYPKAIIRLGFKPIDYLNKLKEFGFNLFLIDEDRSSISQINDPVSFIEDFPNSEFVRNIYATKNKYISI